MPERDQFFIAKTSRSIIENVPFNNSEMALLELSTVENHTVFYWHYEEINPYDSKFQNIVMRYEEMPHFLFSRLHPRNVMHNIHDDVLGMFFLLREIMGGGDERHKMHFSLDSHRVLLLDPYGKTDSTRPLQYLSKYPVRFKNSYLAKDKNVITCFRDATVGNTKVATFYQYGFSSPQSKIPHKELNGMFIREVAEWYVRRIGLQMGFDEDMTSFPSVSSKKSVFGNRVSSVDLRESDIIVILSRKGNRLILNEDELAKYLTDRFKLETIFVRNEDHTFEEQVGYLRRARIVLGMHGSILMMIMFCRRGTVIVEMFPFGVPSAHYTPYKTLSELTGMNLVYRAWENKQEENSVGHPEYHELLGGFGQLSEAKKKEVLETKTVPEHICCSSPFWLYRIYQDTQVNLQEVGNTIEEAVTFSRREILSSLYETNYDAPNFIKPSTVMNASCIDGSKRQPGEIWARWDSPWNNAKVDQWNIFILNSQTEYVTRDHKPTFAIGGFNPGEVVEFQLRPLVYGKYRAPWGAVCECIA
jgi:protein O-mannose beta-1,4-N-acetylglucosaminyltransferase